MRNNEQGRSMIEMLGVLAIIGVLSVGGLAGYAKAMAKYRVNKTIDQVANVVANTRVLFGSQRTYADLGTEASETASKIIKKAKMLPDTLKETEDNSNVYTNAYSGDFTIHASGRFTAASDGTDGGTATAGDARAFMLKFTSIPTDACIDLATQDWNASAGSGLLAIGIESTKGEAAAGESEATSWFDAVVSPCTTSADATSGQYKYCAETADDPMALSAATDACESSNNLTTIYFKFY